VSHAPDITRLLDKLQQRGLITRERPADNRRLVQVAITSEGLALLKKLDKPVRKCHEQQLGHLSTDELHQLVNLLETVRRPHEVESSVWTPK
jgi:DNA-binding MarR family transcriptional regulator